MIEKKPDKISLKKTRRPNKKSRNHYFTSKERLKDFLDLMKDSYFDTSDSFIIGSIELAIIVIIILTTIGIWAGGFIIIIIELLILTIIGIATAAWAWLRGHPKVAVLTIDDKKWVRNDISTFDRKQDLELINSGTEPSLLGYKPLEYKESLSN